MYEEVRKAGLNPIPLRSRRSGGLGGNLLQLGENGGISMRPEKLKDPMRVNTCGYGKGEDFSGNKLFYRDPSEGKLSDDDDDDDGSGRKSSDKNDVKEVELQSLSDSELVVVLDHQNSYIEPEVQEAQSLSRDQISDSRLLASSSSVEGFVIRPIIPHTVENDIVTVPPKPTLSQWTSQSHQGRQLRRELPSPMRLNSD